MSAPSGGRSVTRFVGRVCSWGQDLHLTGSVLSCAQKVARNKLKRCEMLDRHMHAWVSVHVAPHKERRDLHACTLMAASKLSVACLSFLWCHV